ncbi:hypothetical protein [Actinoalloteichus caeruleus]|uniref:hypothetical protein n=1 Tax=Actinoalloteichus cyanogriseus TaxID=2893586 RepID=UPI003AB07145
MNSTHPSACIRLACARSAVSAASGPGDTAERRDVQAGERRGREVVLGILGGICRDGVMARSGGIEQGGDPGAQGAGL